MSNKPLSDLERIKTESNYLRGTLVESLADPITGALAPDDQQLIKFHGAYQQTDRDFDEERRRQKLEPLISFMIRVRVPSGVLTPKQWLDLDELTEKHCKPTLKLTTRQAVELHGVVKRKMKTAMQGIHATLLDSLAGCGDVNRNVMTSANPWESPVHQLVFDDALKIHKEFTPKTTAYHEIWLDDELVVGGEQKEDHEPLYGKTYLPRKFKVAIAIPPRNDVDVFANDLGFIAIIENGELVGYNLLAGGGMGSTFGMETTYPRLANVIGFVKKEDIVEAAKAVLIFQRDHGNRSERKFSRLKYTIDKFGLDYFNEQIKDALGDRLTEARPFKFDSNGDKLGWSKGYNGKWYFTLFIQGGKVRDDKHLQLKTGLREIASVLKGNFILTGNQNLVIGDIDEQDKAGIDALLGKWNLVKPLSGLRRNNIACVALPVCTMAFAEAERYAPSLIDKLEKVLEKYNLLDEDILFRMTGCPNGCGRPFLGEIGLVGKSPGKYNLYLGAGFTGERLNKLYAELVEEHEVIGLLTPIFERFSKERLEGERFGDFVIRKGYVQATTSGLDFHQNIKLAKFHDIKPVLPKKKQTLDSILFVKKEKKKKKK